VFLHFSNVLPEVSGGDFESLRGRIFSFLVTEKDGRRQAWRALLLTAQSATVGR
jgi:hypothetical protein